MARNMDALGKVFQFRFREPIAEIFLPAISIE